MDISNMILENLKWQALEQITKSVWGDTQTTKTIASQALPFLMKQLEKTSQDETAAEGLNTALNDHMGESKIDVEDGKNILKHLFGGDSSQAVKEIAAQTGKSEEESEGVLGALSSVLMETLGDQKKAAGGMDTGDLMKLLSGVGKDNAILAMVMDQDGDGDFDKDDMVKFGWKYLKDKFLAKK